jgi:putative methyltransferase (TIGR04325 family)
MTTFNVWDGVYPSFAAATAVGPGFDGDIWRDRSLQAARNTLALVGTGQPLDYSLRQRNALLPLLTASVLAAQPRASILDFGGGPGTGFMVVANSIPGGGSKIDYVVTEVDSICRAGEEVFAGKEGPRFISELPANGAFDIVLAASVMQYIEDWRSMVARLAGYGAPHLLFADMFVGDFQTFVTLQTYYSSSICHWFFNNREFIAEVERHGYRLALRSTCDAKILGQYGPLPMDNFPAELRIPHTTHLLFQRAGA